MLPFYKPLPKFFVPSTPSPLPIDNLPQPIGRFGVYRPPLANKILNSLERAKKTITPELANNNIFV